MEIPFESIRANPTLYWGQKIISLQIQRVKKGVGVTPLTKYSQRTRGARSLIFRYLDREMAFWCRAEAAGHTAFCSNGRRQITFHPCSTSRTLMKYEVSYLHFPGSEGFSNNNKKLEIIGKHNSKDFLGNAILYYIKF